MCVVSMIFDHYWDKWKPRPYGSTTVPPWHPGESTVPWPKPLEPLPFKPVPNRPTAEEITEFKRLLERAREYDRKYNQPDCELAEKRERIKKLADELGIGIDFL